jgi:hypothetical protein
MTFILNSARLRARCDDSAVKRICAAEESLLRKLLRRRVTPSRAPQRWSGIDGQPQLIGLLHNSF